MRTLVGAHFNCNTQLLFELNIEIQSKDLPKPYKHEGPLVLRTVLGLIVFVILRIGYKICVNERTLQERFSFSFSFSLWEITRLKQLLPTFAEKCDVTVLYRMVWMLVKFSFINYASVNTSDDIKGNPRYVSCTTTS